MNFKNIKIVCSIGLIAAIALLAIYQFSKNSLSFSAFTPTQTNNETALSMARKRAEALQKYLQKYSSIDNKKEQLLKDDSVQKSLKRYPEVVEFLLNANSTETYVLALAAALDQFDSLFKGFELLPEKAKSLRQSVSVLVEIERFYQPLGGLLGYHTKVLQLLSNPSVPSTQASYSPPPFQDMRKKNRILWKACYEGVRELPRTAYIFPIGGSSDRLNLIDETTKEQLPAASFIFLGRSLFEWLVRDVEAQSYWHYTTFGKQVTPPILLMTSLEKNNDKRIAAMGNKEKWFGYNQDSFFRMIQPQVLLVDFDGKWVSNGPLNLVLKPGGHGVLWKLAQDSGAFRWLQERHVDMALVRQINNPLAGLDNTFFTLAGYGILNKKSFGFASCPMKPGFAEGLNVLSTIPKEGSTISNIEYTFFKTLQTSHPHLFETGSCPANTNILFAYIPSIEKAIKKDPIPGLLINPKTCVEINHNGTMEKKMAARLESSMQNIADSLRAEINPQASILEQKKALMTFLNLYEREKLISTTKRAYVENQNPYETPESCFYDWTQAMRKLLSKNCAFTLPPEQTLEQFLQKGPSFTFLFHPALGPLWDVIRQKISHGTLAPGSEVELEIAELHCRGLTVNGSFRLIANNVVGTKNERGENLFSEKVGRAKLKNCIIMNSGIESQNISAYIQGKQQRAESCEIVLEGFSELIAEDVTIKGDFRLVVPDGKRARLTQDASGTLSVLLEEMQTPSWKYKVNWDPQKAPQLLVE